MAGTNCKHTLNSIARRTVFSKWSIKRKLSQPAAKLPEPVVETTDAGFRTLYCDEHLRYIFALEAQHLGARRPQRC